MFELNTDESDMHVRKRTLDRLRIVHFLFC